MGNCHFHYIYCVHLMGMSSTCVLDYAMSSLPRCLPCIFVINVVTRTSMQTRLRDVADFSPCSAVTLMPCKLDATERSMLILRYFSKDILRYCYVLSIHVFVCIYGVPQHDSILLYFCYKMFPDRLFTCYSILPRLLYLILGKIE